MTPTRNVQDFLLRELIRQRKKELKQRTLKRITEERREIEENLRESLAQREERDEESPVPPLELTPEVEETLLDLDFTELGINDDGDCGLEHLPEVLEILKSRDYIPDTNQILNLRLVSKSWKTAVDKYILESLYTGPEWYLRLWNDVRDKDFEICINDIETADEIISALSQEETKGTIFTRAIEIVEKKGLHLEGVETFRSKIRSLLELCGETVWSLSYRELGDWGLSSTEMYMTLRSWLSLLPNLKVLKVAGCESRHTIIGWLEQDIDDPEGLKKEVEAEAKAIERMVKENPIPFISSMELFYGIAVPSPIMEAVFQGNTNLKCVETDVWTTVDENAARALAPLRLEKFRCGYFTNAMLSVLQGCDWSLKHVTLSYATQPQETGWQKFKTSEFFTFLNKFSDTLIEVDFNLELTDDGGFLELPNVKKFFFTFSPEFYTFNFMLPMASIETLRIGLWGKVETEPEDSFETIRLRKYLENRWKSNIWEIFPSLKRLTLFNVSIRCGFYHVYDKKNWGKVVLNEFRKRGDELRQLGFSFWRDDILGDV